MAKFNQVQKFTKANIQEISQKSAIVYKLEDGKGKNLYTGIAGRGRGKERLLEHKKREGDIIPGVKKFAVAPVKNKTRAAKVERQIIKKERPKFNIQHK